MQAEVAGYYAPGFRFNSNKCQLKGIIGDSLHRHLFKSRQGERSTITVANQEFATPDMAQSNLSPPLQHSTTSSLLIAPLTS